MKGVTMRILLGAVVFSVGLVGALVNAQGAITPDTYSGWMKNAGTANTALRMKLMNNQATAIAPEAKQLAQIFTDAEKFWAQYKKADAVKLAQEASKGFTEAAAAAAAGDGMKAMMAANNATATCKQCHGNYREGNPQEGFRFKAGVLQ
jgi:hypothetical protein